MKPAIELSDLTLRMGGRTVLEGLCGSFESRALGLLGPNGAGKSTLINTLLGFHTPTSGAARVFGVDPCRHPDRARRLLGHMPESDAFIAQMSGVHFVRYMAELSGLPAREALERAHEVLFYVGLGEARYRRLGTYSIGMKQLIKLAQAIVHGPRLLFLDEPTNGLDPSARRRMIRLIGEIKERGETTLVISSHLLPDVERCCDEVVILHRGRMRSRAKLGEHCDPSRRLLELELSHDAEGYARELIALGCDCAAFVSPSGTTRLRVVQGEALEVRTLYRVAEKHGVLIRSLTRSCNSLEELFLEAVREPEESLECDGIELASVPERFSGAQGSDVAL